MRLVIQRVQEASCVVEGKVTGSIAKGFMILVGIKESDTIKEVEYLARKVSKLRIFDDEDGKMNLDIHQINGAILSISQFTLLAQTRKGNRPSFVEAKRGEEAIVLYEQFNHLLRQEGLTVQTGVFGADMKIHLVNDGPVTIVMESDE